MKFDFKTKDKLPMPIHKYSFFYRLIRNILYYISLFFLILRTFFIEDRTMYFLKYIVPTITTCFLGLSHLFPDIFSAFTATYFFLWLGMQLILCDLIGSFVVTHIKTNLDPVLSVTTLISLQHNQKYLRRFIGFKALIVGTTPMTATGRASLIVGVCTGTAWLANNYLDRQAANQRAAADRQAMDQRAAADRQAMDQRAAADRKAKYDFYEWRTRYDKWNTEMKEWQKSKKGPAPVEPKRPVN